MPPYPGNNLANILRNNAQVFLWDNEVVAVGTLSRSFLLERINRSFYPWGLSFEVAFASAPGAFNIYILGANNDIGNPYPGYYNQIGNINVVNSANVGRWDMPTNVWPKYVAAYVAALGNAVAMTLTATK
jgi:hypothetical protein